MKAQAAAIIELRPALILTGCEPKLSFVLSGAQTKDQGACIEVFEFDLHGEINEQKTWSK